jgi:hypothetical protein
MLPSTQEDTAKTVNSILIQAATSLLRHSLFYSSLSLYMHTSKAYRHLLIG